MSRLQQWGVAAAGVLVALAASSLSAQDIGYTGSVGYATGSYDFAERTSSVSILNGLTLAGGRWSLSATVPITIQNTGDVSYVGGMQVPTGSTRDGMGRHSGGGSTAGYEAVLADPVIQGAVTVVQGFGFFRNLELRAMAKAPVADPATGVGTGQWDAGGGVSAGFGTGRTYLFADASVWSPGDLPDLELKTYGSLAAGVGRPLSDRWSALASVSVSSAMIDGISPPATLGAGLSYRLAEGRSMNIGASAGLTDSAPDFSIYLGWSAGP